MARDIATESKSDKDVGNLDDKVVNLVVKSTTVPTTTSSVVKIELKSSFVPRTTTVSPTTTTLERSTSRKFKAPKSTLKPVVQDTEPFPTPTPSLAPTTPKLRVSTSALDLSSLTKFRPGCLADLILLIDASGSVEETFNKEKELAAGIIENLNIGPDSTRISLIKFAGKDKVRTFLNFNDLQSQENVLRQLHRIPFSSGITALHMGLLEALNNYEESKGARPGKADPILIIFTDGFSQKDSTKEIALLREKIPHVFAIAINHRYPISRVELEKITGDPRRVFTDSNIEDFDKILKQKFKNC